MSFVEDYEVDPADLIINEQRRSESRAISALSDSPDDAARAEQLARVSRENPEIVYGNLEEREKQLKTALTTQLLNNNQFLRRYIDAHPLANKVSNDDYGQLDAVTQATEKLPGYRKFAYNIATGIESMIGLSAEGLGFALGAKGTEGATERMKAKTLKDVAATPEEEKQFKESESSVAGVVGQGVGTMIGLAPSVVAGGLVPAAVQMGLSGGAEARKRAAAAGVDEQTQATAFTTGFAINSILGAAPLHLLTRPAQAGAPGALSWSVAKLKDAGITAGIFTGFGELQHAFNEYAAKLLYDPKATYHPDFNRIVGTFILGGMMGATFNKVKPYVEAGQEIPPGAHPVVDQAKAKQAEVDIDNLDAALKEASKSATRERSPELFKIFMRQHTDAKIGVSAEAIVKMYGDKEPVVDDNKLGWVLNIKEQLAVARETGGDVEIPLADWLAHVDPALAKELHNDVRVRPNGLTVREGTALEAVPMVEAWHASPHEFDAFSMEKIGTGEGAQSYGHGLYFAESEEVSGPKGAYTQAFERITLNGKPLNDLDPKHVVAQALFKAGERNFVNPSFEARKRASQTILGMRDPTRREALELLKYPQSLEGVAIIPGNTYRVRIHAEKDQFLDWDRAFKDQHPNVIEGLKKSGVEINKDAKLVQEYDDLVSKIDQDIGVANTKIIIRRFQEGDPKFQTADVKRFMELEKYFHDSGTYYGHRPEMKGEELYRYLSDTPATASRMLREAGIPGIRYLDQGSRHMEAPPEMVERLQDLMEEYSEFRAKGVENLSTERMDRVTAVEKEIDAVKAEIEAYKESQKTYNYVIFDEKLIEIVDRNGEAIQAVREQAGLEPLAQAGDLTLRLKMEAQKPTPEAEGVPRGWGSAETAKFTHKYELITPRGIAVADLDLSYVPEKKEVYVHWVGGKFSSETTGSSWAVNAFGPSTIRDVLKQIRQQFPEAETIVGNRISGARGKVMEDTDKGFMPDAKISLKQSDNVITTELRRLWTDEKLEHAAEALEGQVIERGPGIKTVEPAGELTVPEIEAVVKANEVLERILPAVEKIGARLITQDGKGGIQGMFQQYTDRIPTIMYLMDPKKAVHTVRHEAIHFLRREGFFTAEEWDTLRSVAIKDGWIEHYDIGQRYPKENLGRMLEEAVAERYADWADGNKYGTEKVESIFGKIKNLAFNVVKVIKEALPHDMTVEEIFNKIESGEVGKRTGTKPLDKEAFRAAQEMAPEAEQAQRDLFAKANAIGMTVPQYERYMRLIRKRGEEDMKAQMERAEAFERKKQTKEWKADEERIRDEVTNDIQFRPDIAAATFFTEGRLYDTIKNQSPKLDASLIPEEYAGRLPKELLIKKGGINPDDIAPLFGYQTGKEMISKLVEMNEARGELPFKEFVKGIVDDEVSQRMLREHGMLEENILKAAQEHVIGDTQMDILHEEFLGLGMKSKALANPFTKDQIKAWAAEQFDRLPVSNISLEKFLREAGKAGKETEMKLLIGKVEEAFQQKQRQYIAMLMANEAKKLEREQEQFDKTAKRFAARKIENVEQSYTDYVQALLSLAGLRVRRSDKEIAESIEAFGTGSLESFVKRKENEGWDIAVTDNIQQKNIKPIEQMNVAEFREFKEAIDSLVHIGREEKKIIVGEEKRFFDEVKEEIIENIVQLPERSKKVATRLLYSLDASLVKMEEIAKDLDLRKQAGPMFKALILPLIHSKRRENDMLKKLAQEFDEIKGFAKDWKKTLEDHIPNDFLIDPRGDVPFDLTRQSMINIMLNFGNRSNIAKFTEGYAGKKNAAQLESRLWALFDQHAKPEDWQFVQKIWDLFETWRGESDAMYRRISGVPPKWIEVEPIITRHGEFKGGYFPIIYDKLRSNAAVIEDKSVPATSTFGSNYFKATTGAGYAKSRTGYIDYVQFENSIEQVAGRMQQMIHDISHREAVMSVGKIIYDRQIRAAMRKHYGPEYEGQLHPWLRDVANNFNANEPAIGFWNNLLSRARGNLVIHALGFNARVILSPNLGMFNPNQARKFYSDYRFNRDLVMSKSEEIPHTMRNLDRDFQQKIVSTVKKNGWNEFQAKAFEVSMWPALQLEQQARMVGFYTRYNRAIRKGLSEADAVAEADNAVRSFHGAAGTVDLPSIMRGGEFQKIATVFYGFFNTMYNWQRQMPGQLKRGEFIDAYKTLYGSVLIPAAFGALLFNQAKESDSWFKTIGKALALQPLSTIPIIREAASYFAEGFPPRSPLESIMNAAGAVVSDVKKYRKGKRITKPIQHGANVVGLGLGLPLAQIGRSAQFGYDVGTGKQRPRNVQEWVRGVISGEARLKP